jgi:IMP dehydrogenase
MCTTRVETGHGIPQFTAVAECALEARLHGKYVWADGGVTSPGEAVRLLGAGASRVMLGTVLSGTFESSAEAELIDGVWYKRNHGMAGSRSVVDRHVDHEDELEADIRGMYVEGVSEAPIAIKADMPSVLAVVGKYATGAQSGFSYSGSIDMTTLHAQARFRVQTAMGFVEGTPHGKK